MTSLWERLFLHIHPLKGMVASQELPPRYLEVDLGTPLAVCKGPLPF